MLTIFTTTKPFKDNIAITQRNAIESWSRLDLRPQVLVFGDAEGTEDECRRLGIRHIPDIDSSRSGTPLVSAMFARAEELSETPFYCYVNADIMLTSDFAEAVRTVAAMRSFLMVGRRWDVDIEEHWDFGLPDWEARLIDRTRGQGKQHSAIGIDYFVYPRGFWGEIRPFAIGRSAWDNWLIYRARSLRAPVIDATDKIIAVHQNHGYGHHPQGERGVWEGEEAAENRALAGGLKYAFNIDDATHRLTPGGIKPARSRQNLKRRIVTFPVLRPRLGGMFAPLINLAVNVRHSTMRREGLDS